MSSLPVDDINLLINANSTALQKRTAYKVMQRYFRNVASNDFNQQVNFDEDITTQFSA